MRRKNTIALRITVEFFCPNRQVNTQVNISYDDIHAVFDPYYGGVDSYEIFVGNCPGCGKAHEIDVDTHSPINDHAVSAHLNRMYNLLRAWGSYPEVKKEFEGCIHTENADPERFSTPPPRPIIKDREKAYELYAKIWTERKGYELHPPKEWKPWMIHSLKKTIEEKENKS